MCCLVKCGETIRGFLLTFWDQFMDFSFWQNGNTGSTGERTKRENEQATDRRGGYRSYDNSVLSNRHTQVITIPTKRLFQRRFAVKTSQPIKTKIGRSDHAGEYIRSAKKIWGPLSSGAPTEWPFVKLLRLCSVPPFFPPNQPTGQTSLSPTMYYASNDVVSLIYVPFWGKIS